MGAAGIDTELKKMPWEIPGDGAVTDKRGESGGGGGGRVGGGGGGGGGREYGRREKG